MGRKTLILLFLVCLVFFSASTFAACWDCATGSSDSGDRSTYCECDEQEKCKDPFRKSTVWEYSTGLGCGDISSGIDYCSDKYTLEEAYLDCYSCDEVKWVTIDCRDYGDYVCSDGRCVVGDPCEGVVCDDYCGSDNVRYYNGECSGGNCYYTTYDCDNSDTGWTYECPANYVRRRKSDYSCSAGSCVESIVYEYISYLGDSDYCDKRADYCTTKCTHGQYDCDSNSECASGLECKGGISSIGDGCCYSSEYWNDNTNKCVQCYSDSQCQADYCTDWQTICTTSQVKRTRTCYDYYCTSSGTCSYTTTPETQTWDNGHEDFCKKKKEYCGVGCSRGQYDCDYDSECASGLNCKGPIGGNLDGCCNTNEQWDDAGYRCVECLSDSHCHSDYCTEWAYTCTSTQVKRERTCYDYYCTSSGMCAYTTNPESEVVSSNGDSDYCNERSAHCTTKCTHGQYDCDSNSECATGLECMGPLAVYSDGCCYPGTEKWDHTLLICYTLHDHKGCYDGDVYWYDSRGERQDKAEECGDSGWAGDAYCDSNKVYRDYVNRGCSNAACTASTEKRLVETCDGWEKCVGGECVAKTCEEMGYPKGSCSGLDPTKCIDNDAYECKDVGSTKCWSLKEDCGPDEYCRDPVGSTGAHCTSNPIISFSGKVLGFVFDNGNSHYEGLPNLKARLYDKDLIDDALIGEATTDAEGHFSFTGIDTEAWDAGDGDTADLYVVVKLETPIVALSRAWDPTIISYNTNTTENAISSIQEDIIIGGPQAPMEDRTIGILLVTTLITVEREYALFKSFYPEWSMKQVFIEIHEGEDTAYWEEFFKDEIHLYEERMADFSVVAHEYGHAVMWNEYGTVEGEGAAHTPWSEEVGRGLIMHHIDPSDPEFAMMEGWAEFMQSVIVEKMEVSSPCEVDGVVRTGVLYYSKENNDWDVNCSGCCKRDIETNKWWMGGDYEPDNSGAIVEGAVASIFWDIYDSENGDELNGQGISDGFKKIWSIIREDNPDNILEFWDHWVSTSDDTPTNYGDFNKMAYIYEMHGIDKCPDDDDDGYDRKACGGDDCDDNDKSIHPGAAELCDGKDNDCDGSTDEGFNVGGPCAAGLGECRRTGQYVCTANGLGTECNAVAGTPATEVCDGKDNDCDGGTDEDLGTTTCGIGACRVTVQNCIDGLTQVCVPKAPNPEVCDDDIDNDCDGKMDCEDPDCAGSDACIHSVCNYDLEVCEVVAGPGGDECTTFEDCIGECACSSCDDCEAKLDKRGCVGVYLTEDIESSTTCIDNPAGSGGKTVDCRGHAISGTGSPYSAGYGINLKQKSGMVIKNCNVERFSTGISLDSCSDSSLSENKVGNNYYGAVVVRSLNNNLTSNTINKNYYGIILSNSKDNIVDKNVVCGNMKTDFSITDTENSGDENTCDKPGGWNDEGSTGCTYTCPQTESEFCDGMDNDEDGQTDEGCDDDGDGYCDEEMVYVVSSECPYGPGDCDDTNQNIHPGRSYQVYYKDDLMEKKWQKLGSAVRARSDEIQIVDESAREVRMRFYVVMLLEYPGGADSNLDGIPDNCVQVNPLSLRTQLDGNGDIALSWPAEGPPIDTAGDGIDQNCDGLDGINPLSWDQDFDGVPDSEDLCPDEPGECEGCPTKDCGGCSVGECAESGPICTPDDSRCGKMKCPRSGEKDLDKCGKSFVVNYPTYGQMSCVMVDETTGECQGECPWTCGPREVKAESESPQTSNVNVNNLNRNVNRNTNTNLNANYNQNYNKNT